MAKFWSDDFDMDLLKLFPDLPKMLGRSADISLWTVGHTTYERLNSPCCWNQYQGLSAIVWPYKPDLPRDEHGWFNVNGLVANEPEVECTWLELLRDQWPHSYGFVLIPTGKWFPEAPRYEFDQIMWDLRGWRKSPEIEKHRAVALSWIVAANQQIENLCLAERQPR